ncbi:uncharacterized protein ACNLHF_023123 isoform 2-T2 [Anomaloglossus baeobatrachus]
MIRQAHESQRCFSSCSDGFDPRGVIAFPGKKEDAERLFHWRNSAGRRKPALIVHGAHVAQSQLSSSTTSPGYHWRSTNMGDPSPYNLLLPTTQNNFKNLSLPQP